MSDCGYIFHMAKKNTYTQAIKILKESSSIILQKTVKGKTIVLKFHKLDCPNVRYTSASNGEVEHDLILQAEEAISTLALALQYI